MDENIIAIAHVETEMEADLAIAALADGGINAVKEGKNTLGGSTLLAMPTAMGFGASEGYDIVINASYRKKAAEILAGIGVMEAAEDETEEAAEETVQETPPQPEEPQKASPLMVILFLAALGLFVIGVDKLIELIKSLLY